MASQKSFHRRRQVIAVGRYATAFGFSLLVSTARAETTPSSVRLPRLSAGYELQSNAREGANSVLWQNAQLNAVGKESGATPQQIQQNVRAIIASDPTLSQAYGWRQIVRGEGQQTWNLTDNAAGSMRLQVGKQALPVMQLTGLKGSRAAAGLSGNGFGLYSTKPMRTLNQSLEGADALLGNKIFSDATELNWLSVRPLETKHGSIDIVYVQGQNDINPNSLVKKENQLWRGAMAGAKIAYALPARWKLDGEWMRSKMDEAVAGDDDAASGDALILGLAGPIKHPWGETGVRLSYREIGTDFSSFAGTPSDAGTSTKTLAVVQPFKTGDFSGSLGLNWSARAPIDGGDGSTPVAPSDTAMQVTSKLKWQATSALALTATHDVGSRFLVRTSTSDLLADQITERENSTSRLGLDWKMSKRFTLAAAGGLSRYDEQTADERLLRRLSNQDEFYSLKLKNKTSATQWDIGYERRIALDLEGESGAQTDTLTLGAQTKLTSWLKYGGSYNLAQTENLSSGLVAPRSDLTANATFTLQELGELQLRYTHALRTPVEGVRLGTPVGASGYGVRYVLGSSGGEGLGLSLDYARRETSGPTQEQWKIGLTYR